VEALNQTVFVTMSAYALGRKLGLEGAMAELNRQIDEPSDRCLPGIRTIARLRTLCDVALRLDTGGSVLGKVRSRHFCAALESGADLWISVDDDVEATIGTLANMLQAVWGLVPRIVIAPCIIRGVESGPVQHVNVDLPRIVTTERTMPGGARLRPCKGGGFGLVALNRFALIEIAQRHPELEYRDDDGAQRLGVFHDELVNGQWFNEDLSFFRRVPETVFVEALLTGVTSHDGEALPLERVER
jgi:hypothetical protein